MILGSIQYTPNKNPFSIPCLMNRHGADFAAILYAKSPSFVLLLDRSMFQSGWLVGIPRWQ